MKRSRRKRLVMLRNIEQLNYAQDVIEAARLALRAFDLSRIETNLVRIEKLSGKREKENWEFRAFLKSECEPEILDALVHELNRMVSEAVDCSACLNCCRETVPSFDQEDIERFAEGLGSSPEEFSKEYLIISDEGDLTFRSVPCPFLGDKGCKNQEARPKDCVSFPHLHKEDILGRLMGMVMNYSICPIVFNVYEGLKEAVSSEQ